MAKLQLPHHFVRVSFSSSSPDFSHKVQIVYHDALKFDALVDSPVDRDYDNVHTTFVVLNFEVH
jgi:hypothetical protein